MIYPLDINKRIKDKGKATAGENRNQLILLGFFLLNAIGYFLCSWVISMVIGYGSIKAVLLVMLVINVAVGIFIFRFLIFDEHAKIKEYNEASSDSFARYMHIRKDVNHTINVHDNRVHIVEMSDGSAAFVVEFRFGSNDNQKAMVTKGVIESLYKVAGSFGMEVRTFIMPEDIMKSDEYAEYINTINNVEDIVLRNCMGQMTDAIMTESAKYCNVNCLRLMVRSTSTYQRAELEAVLKNFFAILMTGGTAFRSIRFLDFDHLMHFLCDFYGMSAIDVSMMHALDIAKDMSTDYNKLVSVYSLRSCDGKVYTSAKTERKIFDLGEKEIG